MRGQMHLRIPGLVLLGLLCGAMNLRAQVQAGSETTLNLDGSISTGYAGSMTNQGPDSQGLTYGGTGNLSGSFHSAQFLNFDVAPFFNQSRDNSGYQSISQASGVTASANIFGGSQFPGYINFTKLYNSDSTFAIPGLANYATNGNSQTFGVGWSANLKRAPSISVGYQQGSNDYSLYGAPQNSTDDFHSVFGNAVYNVDGLHLSGGVHYSSSNSLFPQLVTGEPTQHVSSDTTVYTFNVTRTLPLQGNVWVNFARDSTGYDTLGLNSSESTDLVTGGVALKPTDKLNTQINFDYNDNLAGSILQTFTGTGAVVPISIAEAPSHSWGLVGQAQYALLPGLYITGAVSHREQIFLGTSYDSNSYSGSVNYGHKFLGGQLTAGATVSENSYGTDGGSMLGLLTNVSYIRQFGAWGVSGSFGYSQNMQSLLIAYTTSGYSYSGSANRRIHSLILTLSGSGSKSVLSQAQGPNTFTQAYSAGLSGRWLGVSGGYSHSTGSGLITPVGITPVPPGLPPGLLTAVSYGGTTYSASVGSAPHRGLSVNGSYVDTHSSTQDPSLFSNNKMQQGYVYMSYQFRKVYFNAGYSRLLQGFSASPQPAAMIATYYVGVSRWFKAF